MQSMEYKRFPYQLVGLLIAAAAAVVIILTATGTLFDDNDATVDSPRTELRGSPVNRPISREQSMFLEWNTNLPGSNIITDQMGLTDAPTRQPDTTTRVDGRSRSIAEPTVIPYEHTRYLEANELPGDHAPYFPDPSQPGGSMNAY